MTVLNITEPVVNVASKTTKSEEMDIPRRFSIKTTEKETLSHWFHLMVLGRALDDRAPNYLKQAIGWSYHAPYAGHHLLRQYLWIFRYK